MKTPIGKARDEGNCVGAIQCGEEACEEVRKGTWHMAKAIASGVGMTNAWLQEQGLLSLKTLWASLVRLR